MDGTPLRSPVGKQLLGQSLGHYLKDRRVRLDPVVLGYLEGRPPLGGCGAKRSYSAPISC